MNNLKKMDLVFFSIISIIAELVTAISFANLSTGFYFSFAILIFIIFSIRWGNISIIALILSGIPLIFIQPIGNWQSIEIWKGILYYMVVNVFAIIPIAIYGKRNRNKLISGPIILTLYVLAVFLSLSLGKEIALLIINGDWLGGIKYFISEIFILVVSVVVLLILAKLKIKLICDMDEFMKEEKLEDDFVNKIQEKGESETNGENSDERIED
ncbi:MAG: hypothetical protein HFG90_04785 [Acholeplasmatales bacterium]|nr:hypothetical protein [Acholeplasmatales bacterium]